MKLWDAIKGRKSVRRYSHKKPNWKKIIRAIDAARHAPTAGNLFVMKFIMIDDPDTILKLTATTQQDFIGTAKYLVVAVSDPSKLVRQFGEKGKIYSHQQAGASIENFLLALTEEKLSTSWIGHLYEEQVKQILEIPQELIVEALFPIGIETSIKPKRKKKVDLENYLYFHKWKNKKMDPQTRVKYESM